MNDAYLKAFNAGDVEGLARIYAEDAVFTLGNLPFGPDGQPVNDSYNGRGEALGAHQQSIDANAKIELLDASVEANTLTGRFSYTDEQFVIPGPLTGTLVTVVEQGRITSLTMTFDEDTYGRWKASLAPASTSLLPIVVDDGTASQDSMDQLPGGEVECIRQSLGESAFSEFMRSDFSGDTSEEEEKALSLCLSNESISRFFIGFAVNGLGGLGDPTIACMADALSRQELQAIFSSETAWGEAFQALVDCLNDEESARAEAGGFFGGVEDAPGSPGLVDVGDHQLYLTCQGEGSPTVVMESGGRGHSGGWDLVQPSVASFTRVCAYDRAGTGRSESVPPQGTAQAIADDLHSLLKNAGIDGPYVLVGHSLGGILVRVFANTYLDEVAGMVLVDTGHGDPIARFQEVLTPEEWQLVRDVILHDDDGFTLPGGLDLMGPDLGDSPLVVLTAGRLSRSSPLPPDVVKKLDEVRVGTQKELLSLSSNSTHVMVEDSGHSIQRERPDVVIKAIQQVVEAAGGRKISAGSAPRRIPPPQLVIDGNQIKNIHGEQVVLRGVAIADPLILANHRRDKHFIREDYRVLAQEWGANIIRVPIHPPTWELDQRYMEKYLDPLVQWGEELGLYIFLGWHAHGNPITGQVEQVDWKDSWPWLGNNPYDPDLDLAKTALRAMVERYRDKPWVLYGTFNEPSHIRWSEWRPVAEELVDVIHAAHPEAVVFVSGVNWGYDLRGALEDPVRRDNIIYESHPYPGKGNGWKTVLDELRKTTPVFLGEWGFIPESAGSNLSGTTENYGLPLVRYAEARDIGWTAWGWNPPHWELSLLSSWNGYPPTEFGLVVKYGLSLQLSKDDHGSATE